MTSWVVGKLVLLRKESKSLKNIKPTFMVSDWKHKSQCYIRKAYEVKEGGQIREQRHARGMKR